MSLEAGARLVGGDDFEKLLLSRRFPHRREQIGAAIRRLALLVHGHGLNATVAPAGCPSLSGGISIQPSARAIADSGR